MNEFKTYHPIVNFAYFVCVIGFSCSFMNPASVITVHPSPTREMLIFAYIKGAPLDLIHAASTVFFLWVLSEPMIDKLERVKIKYGLVKR